MSTTTPSNMTPAGQTTLAQTLSSTGQKRKLLPTHIDGIPVSILEPTQPGPDTKDRPIVSPKRCQGQTSPSQPAAPDSVPAASAKSGDVDMVQKEGDEDDDSDDDIVILI